MWPFRRVWRGVKKLFRGRRKSAGRKRVARRTPRSAVNRSIVVKKSVKYDRITTVANNTGFGVDTFELADIPQYAAYSGLYDKFKIIKVKVTYRTLTNTSHMYQSPGQVTTTGFVHSIIDTTDGVAPSSIADMMNDSTYRITRGTRDHSRMIYPKFMVNVGGGAQGQSKSGWLNTKLNDNATINGTSHYSIKYAFEGGSAPTAGYTTMIHEPSYTYWIAFKDPK